MQAVHRFFNSTATLFWLLGVAVLVVVSVFYCGESSSFNGIAEATETQVSSEYGVEVLAIPVLAGQEVHAGDTLVRLHRPELAMRINELSRELQGLSGKTILSSSEIERRVSEVKADFESHRNQLQFEVRRLSDERKYNREFSSRLQSGKTDSAANDSTDPIYLRICSLNRELHMAEESMQKQVGILQGSKGAQMTAGAMERGALQQELDVLHGQEAKLVILAKQDGLIANVNVTVGEKISPFAPMLTLTAHTPTLVSGYIHEKVYNRVAMGDSVTVTSSGERGGKVRGIVVGVGSRIVAFPVRLRKVPELVIWGREVMVRIPATNPFLLGEMVSIQGDSAPSWSKLSGMHP